MAFHTGYYLIFDQLSTVLTRDGSNVSIDAFQPDKLDTQVFRIELNEDGTYSLYDNAKSVIALWSSTAGSHFESFVPGVETQTEYRWNINDIGFSEVTITNASPTEWNISDAIGKNTGVTDWTLKRLDRDLDDTPMRDPTTDKDNKILSLTLELDRTKDTVRIQSNQITQKDTEIARLNNDNTRLKNDNDKKGKTITDLNNKMVEKDKQVRNLTDENKKKDVQIKKLTQHVKDKDKTIRDMSKQIKDKNDTIKNQKGKMNKLIKDKKTLVDRTGDLKDKLSTCRNTYQALELQVGNLASQVLNLKANCGWLADHLWYYASYFGGAVQETGIYPYINAYQFHPNNGIRSAARTKNSGAAFW